MAYSHMIQKRFDGGGDSDFAGYEFGGGVDELTKGGAEDGFMSLVAAGVVPGNFGGVGPDNDADDGDADADADTAAATNSSSSGGGGGGGGGGEYDPLLASAYTSSFTPVSLTERKTSSVDDNHSITSGTVPGMSYSTMSGGASLQYGTIGAGSSVQGNFSFAGQGTMPDFVSSQALNNKMFGSVSSSAASSNDISPDTAPDFSGYSFFEQGGMEMPSSQYNVRQASQLSNYMRSPVVTQRGPGPEYGESNSLLHSNASLTSLNLMPSMTSSNSVSCEGAPYGIPSVNKNMFYPSLTQTGHQAGSGQTLTSPMQQQHYQVSPFHYPQELANDTKRRYRVIRGVFAGGCSTKPPKHLMENNSIILPVKLVLNSADVEDVCYSKWRPSEREDGRRIIRIERIQEGAKLIANFSVVGSANENPVTLPAPPDVDVIEVSCLECPVQLNDEDLSPNSDNDEVPKECRRYEYYITSVEVVEIVELLIGTQSRDPAERRRERGRIRSNLVPFWSKKPISSRLQDPESRSGLVSGDSLGTYKNYRMELAKRIMGYEVRKPRGFDKEVRILKWSKLVPALKRALQSYYAEIPNSEAMMA